MDFSFFYYALFAVLALPVWFVSNYLLNSFLADPITFLGILLAKVFLLIFSIFRLVIKILIGIVLCVFSIIYIIFPIDVIPDALIVLGQADDCLLLIGGITFISGFAVKFPSPKNSKFFNLESKISKSLTLISSFLVTAILYYLIII